MQLSTIGPILIAYIQPPGTGPLSGALGIGPKSAAYTTPIFQNSLSTKHLRILMIITRIGHSKKLSNLVKIYINDTNYNKRNNSFTFKMAILHDIYSKIDVLSKAKIKAFSIMVKNLALDYYYSNININAITINFDQVYNSIKNYFNGAKYKQSIFSKQNGLTLKSVISKRKGKLIEKCLEKLINKL